VVYVQIRPKNCVVVIERVAVRSDINVNLLSTLSGPTKLFGIPAVCSGGLGFESGICDQLS
jgi:hypothetical protein